MCRQYLTFYEWCRCEEDAGHTICASRKRQGCRGVSVETVHMQCFCNTHATTSWVSEKKAKKRERRLKRRAGESEESLNEKGTKKWFPWRGLRARVFERIDKERFAA